jgi:hypothetical protein
MAYKLQPRRIKFAEIKPMAKSVAERLPTTDVVEATKLLEAELRQAIDAEQANETPLPLMHAIAAYIGERLIERWGLKWQQADLCAGFPSLKWDTTGKGSNLMPMLWVMAYYRRNDSIALNVANVPRFLATDGEFRMPSETIAMYRYLAAWCYEIFKFSPMEEDAEHKTFALLNHFQEGWTTPTEEHSGYASYGAFLAEVYVYKYKGNWHFDPETEAYGILTEDGKFIDTFKKVERFVQKMRLKAMLG